MREMIIKNLLGSDAMVNHDGEYTSTRLLIDSTAFMGIEIELENCHEELPDGHGTSQVGSIALEHGITAHRDGSLRNGGIELVTRPIRGRRLVSQIDYMCDVAKTAGWEVSNRAGLHVHMDMQDLTFSQYTNFIKAYMLVEPCVFASASAERQRSIYCKSWYENSPAEELRETVGFLARNRLYRWGTRYVGLNLNATSKYGTVEFRHKRTTLDATEILGWVNQIQALKVFARGPKIIDEEYVSHATPDSVLVDVYGTLAPQMNFESYPSYFHHACVPLWFEVFGVPKPAVLDWDAKQIAARRAHQGFARFMKDRGAAPPVPAGINRVPTRGSRQDYSFIDVMDEVGPGRPEIESLFTPVMVDRGFILTDPEPVTERFTIPNNVRIGQPPTARPTPINEFLTPPNDGHEWQAAGLDWVRSATSNERRRTGRLTISTRRYRDN